MKTAFALTGLLLSLIINLNSQVQQEWVSRFNNGYGYDIKLDNAGNIYVFGVGSETRANNDYLTIKYNSSGVLLWSRFYNGETNAHEMPGTLFVDGTGNVYVTGSSRGSSSFMDIVTIKYNSSGVLQWLARYNGLANHNDGGYALFVDVSGNVYIGGSSMGSEANLDFVTVKYNSSGTQLWEKRYDGPGHNNDGVYSLNSDVSGNVYVLGGTIGNGTGNDFTTIKYNSSGVQQWLNEYNRSGSYRDNPIILNIDQSANVYACGVSGIENQPNTDDIVTIKYNTLGIHQWTQIYNGPANEGDFPRSLVLDTEENVIVTGGSTGIGSSSDFITIKYNSGGIEQWAARYNGPGNSQDISISSAIDISGNIYITGTSRNGTSYSSGDYTTIRYNPQGVTQWVQIYNGPGNNYDASHSIFIDNSGNVYITGESIDIDSVRDIATIKYSQTIGIQPVSNEIPRNYLLFQNYPNPFNPITNIKFSIPKNSLVKIIIYDAVGSKIAEIVNSRLNAGTYKVDWNGGNFASGIYYYQLTTESYRETKKMVLIK